MLRAQVSCSCLLFHPGEPAVLAAYTGTEQKQARTGGTERASVCVIQFKTHVHKYYAKHEKGVYRQ